MVKTAISRRRCITNSVRKEPNFMQRRRFLEASSLATATWMTPGWIFHPEEGRIKIGIVGTGWWGTDYLLKYALSI